MAGRTSTNISESPEMLRSLLERNIDVDAKRRVQLYLALKAKPDRSIVEVAKTLKIPERTARRWIAKYKKEGLSGALGFDVLNIESFDPQSTIAPPASANGEKLSEWAISMLNRLPLTFDTVTWSKAMSAILLELLPDCDYVVTNVRTTLDLVNPETNEEGRVNRQAVMVKEKESDSIRTQVSINNYNEKPKWQQLFEQGKSGFPQHRRYHYPVGFDYYYKNDKSYIGTILLFRLVDQDPISTETLQLMQSLRPFFVFMFSDHVARQRMINQADLMFRDVGTRISNDAEITDREVEVLMLMLQAYTYEDIAETLHISVKTVDTHMQSIYRKTDARSMKELLARYLSPRREIGSRPPAS